MLRYKCSIILLLFQCIYPNMSKTNNVADDDSFPYSGEDMKYLEKLNQLYDPIEMLEKTRSPLDENVAKKPQHVNNMKEAFRGRMMNNIKMLSVCQQNCSKGLEETFDAMIESMSHVERYQRICKNYNESSACIHLDKRCGDEDNNTFEVITSGLRYMCVDQVFAFNATIDCIDQQSTVVQSECENLCHTKNVMMNWIMRSSVAQSIQNGISAGLTDGALAGGDTSLGSMLGGLQVPQEGDTSFMNNMKLLGKDMCSVGTCVLDCVRSKFNARCEGSAGTLLSEVFVRPIASTQEKMAIVSPVMGMFFPEECNFLYSGNHLSKHRIDPTLNEELRRMYIKKEVEKNKKMEAKITKTDMPSFKLPHYQKSPFDGETDFTALVDQLYGSKELTLANQVLQKSMNNQNNGDLNIESTKRNVESSKVSKTKLNPSESSRKQVTKPSLRKNTKKSKVPADDTDFESKEGGSGLETSEEEEEGSGDTATDGSGNLMNYQETSGLMPTLEDIDVLESSGLTPTDSLAEDDSESSGEELSERVFFAHAIVGQQISFIYNPHEDGKLRCRLVN